MNVDVDFVTVPCPSADRVRDNRAEEAVEVEEEEDGEEAGDEEEDEEFTRDGYKDWGDEAGPLLYLLVEVWQDVSPSEERLVPRGHGVEAVGDSLADSLAESFADSFATQPASTQTAVLWRVRQRVAAIALWGCQSVASSVSRSGRCWAGGIRGVGVRPSSLGKQ